MGQDEQGAAERVLASPPPRGLVHPATADRGAHVGHEQVEERPVLVTHLAALLGLVAPRPAEDPVVQALPTDTQSAAGAVIGPGDVAVDRGRDARENLAVAHGSSPCCSRKM